MQPGRGAYFTILADFTKTIVSSSERRFVGGETYLCPCKEC
jgi:hypothetical protein